MEHSACKHQIQTLTILKIFEKTICEDLGKCLVPKIASLPCYKMEISLHRKRSFPLRISSVNVTKSTGNRGFGHIY